MFDFLQQQHLIELIRQKNIESALEYAQTHLAERGEENPEILAELERTLALLAFENPELSPFGELLHPSQRQKVFDIWVLLATLDIFYIVLTAISFMIYRSFNTQKWGDSISCFERGNSL